MGRLKTHTVLERLVFAGLLRQTRKSREVKTSLDKND